MGDVFFVASKIAWGLMRVDSLILALLLVGTLALWLGSWQTGRVLVSLSLLVAAVATLSPLGGAMLAALERRHAVPRISGPVAGIVLLGGAEDPVSTALRGQPSVNEAGERFLAALDLARRFPEAPVIFTGGSGRLIPAAIPRQRWRGRC